MAAQLAYDESSARFLDSGSVNFAAVRPGRRDPSIGASVLMVWRWSAAYIGYVRAIDIRAAVVGGSLVLALTGCGTAESDTAEAQGGDPGDGSSRSAEPSVDREEEITPGGIAAIVLQHLGSDAVREFVTYEPEPGSVSLIVQLRDATPHSFGVDVFSPEQAEGFGAAGQCPREAEREPGSQCRTLDNGTTVTTREDNEGFSDDNVDGMVISVGAITPEDGGALAMYESYDDSPAVSVTDLEGLLSDPGLTWLTDPAVNEAGEEIDVTELAG